VTDKTEAKQPSPGAWRMRKSRQRRLDGLRCVQFGIKNAEIQGLISTGLLDPAECEDRRAVARALGCSIASPATGGEVQSSFVRTVR
jgi:hypothetical protein